MKTTAQDPEKQADAAAAHGIDVDRSTVSEESKTPLESVDKTHEEVNAIHQHELAKDEELVGMQKYTQHLAWVKLRYIVLPALAALIIAWWACSVWNQETRHNWVPATILAWWFVGIIFFRFVPSSIFGKPIGRVWVSFVSEPWCRLPWLARYTIGWLALLGLVFGSAYGFPLPNGTTYGDRTISVFGLFVFQLVFWLCSRNKKLIKWNTIIVGLCLQQIVALWVLKSGSGFSTFNWIANAAADFLHQGNDESYTSWFVVGTLGAVIWFIAFVQMMFYLGAMTWLIGKVGWLTFQLLDISGAEATIAAASPFIGQGESACMVRPFVDLMTPSELHLAMTSGFSTISGSVLTGYIALGVEPSSLITASIMSIPASIAISKMVYPEDDVPVTLGRIVVDRGEDEHAEEGNALHAFSNGAALGLRIAGLILCNVLVVLALLYVVDGLLTWIGHAWGLHGEHALTLELIFQYVFYPLSWLMGVPKQDLLKVGRLLGLKLFGNEFVAYLELTSKLGRDAFTARGYLIATYSLCGFANMGSLGIQIGVMSALAPSRAKVLATIGISALLCGFVSTMQAATIAGMMV